jgi:diguanylate cyclase (GGDEF)-like protein
MKEINDKFSHQVGDLALIDTAEILKKSFRVSDTIARIGGDEFVVMAMETPETNLEMLTKRLKANLDIFNIETSKPYQLSFSFGLTLYKPEHPCSIDALISEADKMMYEQKRNKKS